LEQRSTEARKVRQPLQEIFLNTDIFNSLDESFFEIIREELNIKEIKVSQDVAAQAQVLRLKISVTQAVAVAINPEVTPNLKLEGEAREIIRAIQEGRKKAGFNVEDRISLGYTGKDAVFSNTELKELIAHEVLSTAVQLGALADADYSETVDIEEESFAFTLKRV
jgi:isoleucyl-tRNA synthetase